jgi:ubiquinone/menaquinone biosynthesis C-methylase UbiE
MKRTIYKDIAPYYDRLMDGVDYKGWVEYINKICTINHIEPKNILDLGCGTGNPAKYFLENGCFLTGIDGSMEMLKIAKQKLKPYNPLLILSKFHNFMVKSKFNLVVSLFDSLNNILDEEELLESFKCVQRSLLNHGLFAFDMNTPYGLSQMKNATIISKEKVGIYSVWESKYDRSRSIARISVVLFASENGYYRKVEEKHTERGYSFYTLKKLLKRSGFEDISMYEHLSFRRPTSRTGRVMVVAHRC